MAGRYDAVVVGSGPNGLAAAITLARAGRRVLVLEAQMRLGGAVATAELTLPGFHHDVFSAVYPAAAASPVFGRMPLERFGLRWTHPAVAMAHPLPGGRAAALYRDPVQTAANLDALHTGDGARWLAFVHPYLRGYPALRSTFFGGFPPLTGALRSLLALGLGESLELARVALLPARVLADELFEGDGARAWLYGTALHGDVPVGEAGSAVFAFYLTLLGHAAGWPSPEGGAGRLAEALIGYLRSLGGQTRTSAEVRRLTVRDGRVRGVVVGDEEIAAPLVVCDTTPRALVRLGDGALPEPYARRLRRFRYGPPTLKVDWALSGPIPWSAPEARQAGTVHVGGDSASIARWAAEQAAGRLGEQPFMLLGQQSLADPTRAPAGMHTAWGYTHLPSGQDWSDQIDRQVDRMEAQVERFAPGFRDLILERHVHGPAELQRRNANLVDGDVGGGSYSLDQLVFRPVPAIFPYRTPIAGLYLCSASTFPGAAVHGVSGHAAARLALREARIRRFF